MPKGRPLPNTTRNRKRSRIEARCSCDQAASTRLTRDGSANGHASGEETRPGEAIHSYFFLFDFITHDVGFHCLHGDLGIFNRRSYDIRQVHIPIPGQDPPSL